MSDCETVSQLFSLFNLCSKNVKLPESPLLIDSISNVTLSLGSGDGFDHSQNVSADLRLTSGPVSANDQEASG